MNDRTAATTMRGVGALQFTIGGGALIAPRKLAASFGIPPGQLTGDAVLAIRLFAIRQLLLGAGDAVRDPSTTRANLVVQSLDIALFVSTLRSGSIPRKTSLMALTTAIGVTAASIASRVSTRG